MVTNLESNMISHKLKFIFIHIPKCGGTSIEHKLLNFHGISNERLKNIYANLTLHEKQEYCLYYIQDGIYVQHRKINEYEDYIEKNFFTFTFVRNPWDKFLSEYHYIKKFNGCRCSEFAEKFPTFKHFVINDGIRCCYLAHDIPQVDFVMDAETQKQTNFVGRFENLQNDFNIVCDKIGIPHLPLSHKNKGKHIHYAEYYDDETKEIVAKKYAKDIKYFGYEFGE